VAGGGFLQQESPISEGFDLGGEFLSGSGDKGLREKSPIPEIEGEGERLGIHDIVESRR
jgi:hypothetical protein